MAKHTHANWDERNKTTKIMTWKSETQPDWYKDENTSKTSYRAVYRWGKLEYNKNPKEGLYRYCKSRFNVSDDYFKETRAMGLEEVDFNVKPNLTDAQIAKLSSIVGSDNATIDGFFRVQVAYGKTMIDLMRLREKILENIPDMVLYPSTTEEIEQIVQFCNAEKIHIYVYGGGSSVTRGVEAMVTPAITLDMRKNFNKVVKFNEKDQVITVQAGMSGPALEEILNSAVEKYGAKMAYTCGHFPQSFVYSCVGGWVVTRGAGQNSTYYGTIADMVLAQQYVTPIGILQTDGTPRKATGPNMDQIMMGCEGAYGVLTEVTLKFFKKSKANKRFSYMFKSWEDAMNASREIMQGEFGFPSSFRISDAEETDMMMHLYSIADSPLNALLKAAGLEPNKRCLMLGFADGENGYQKNVAKNIKKIAKKYKALSLTGYVTKSWEHGRFDDPYLRDTLQDYGMIIDTLECAVTWEQMAYVHEFVRKFVKSKYDAVCTTHMSHVYPQGANLYFIFIVKDMPIDEFVAYHAGILDAIQKSGASMSHHHGIGKLFAPYNAKSLGPVQMGALRAIKNYFDPNNILNPGGTLWLDKEDK